jgi:hypothetical protein
MFAVFGVLYKYERTGRKSTLTRVAGTHHVQPMEEDAIGKAARHSTIQNASLYFENCMTSWESFGVNKPNQWELNKVSEWRPIYYGTGDNWLRNPDIATCTTMALPVLSQWYVDQELKVTQKNPSWVDVLNLAIKQKPNTTKIEKMKEVLDLLPQYVKEYGKELFQDCLTTVVRHAQRQGQEAVVDESDEELAVAVEGGVADGMGGGGGDGDEQEEGEEEGETRQEPPAATRPKKRRRTEEEMEATRRAKRVKATAVDYKTELAAIKAAKDRTKKFFLMKEYSSLAAGGNNWLKKLHCSFVKVEQCIAKCHGGKLDDFLALKGTLSHTQYTCQCEKRRKK